MSAVYNLPSDTPEYMLQKQVDIVLQKTFLERFQMCAEMTEFMLEMLKQQIRAKNKDITEGRLKFEMIKSLYSDCYSEEEMARIEQHFMRL